MDGLLGVAGMICLIVSQWIIPEISLRLASFSTYWSRFFWMKNRDRNIFFDMKKWSLKSAIFKYHLRIPQLHPSLLRFFSYPTWQEPWRIFPYVFPLSHLICALLIGGFKAFFCQKIIEHGNGMSVHVMFWWGWLPALSSHVGPPSHGCLEDRYEDFHRKKKNPKDVCWCFINFQWEWFGGCHF